MKFEIRDDAGHPAGQISLGLRDRIPVDDDGTFEVDEGERGADVLRRLIAAGHTPLEPEALPDGVDYPPPEAEGSDAGGESDAEAEPEGDSSEEDLDAHEAAESASEEDLDEMNRSELYSFGNEELGLELEWAGDAALDTEAMRERIREEL